MYTIAFPHIKFMKKNQTGARKQANSTAKNMTANMNKYPVSIIPVKVRKLATDPTRMTDANTRSKAEITCTALTKRRTLAIG